MALTSQKFSIESLVNSSISTSESSSLICSAPKSFTFSLNDSPLSGSSTTSGRNLLNRHTSNSSENSPQFSMFNYFMNSLANEDPEKFQITRSENSPSPSLSAPSNNSENDVHLNSSGYSSSSSEDTITSPGIDTSPTLKVNGSQAPIRQTLSYLDVIFPHIQMICGNIDSASMGLKKTKEMDCDAERNDIIPDAISKPDHKICPAEWLELVQNSFFNFPSHSGDSRTNVPFPVTSGNNTNGFFFQQMQKSKRNRTAFSSQQLDHLEQAFRSNHYVIGNERKNLAECLNLSETQSMSAMEINTQKALMNYCCGQNFLHLIEDRLEAGTAADYLPLSLEVAFKIVQMKLYDKWDFVVETLEACDQLFRRSAISQLVRNARFTAWLMNSKNAGNVELAKHVESILKRFLKNQYSMEDFLEKNLATNLEPCHRRLEMLLSTLKNLVVEAYLTRYQRELHKFVFVEDGELGPDEKMLRDRTQRLESRKITSQLMSLNNIIIMDSQSQLV